MQPVVIVGAGMAAYAVARELRKRDQATPLRIVASDAAAAYSKPMLSNAVALGKAPAALVAQDADRMAAQLGAEILSGVTVTAIDTAAGVLRTGGGALPYGRLVLAVGAQPIRLPLEGDAAHEVLSVNHLHDYAVLRRRLDALGRPARVVILGGGLIGCEFADDLQAGGHAITLVDPNPRLLAALAAPSLSAGLARAWEGSGVALRLGTVASGVDHGAATAEPAARQGLRVRLADGGVLEADLVLSAVGLRPNLALAQAAGLATARGILVDRYGATSAPNVYALGDCAEYTTGGGRAVLPFVAPLLAAARAIGASLAGEPAAIALGPEPVVVKTPSYRLALLPPPPAIEGAWQDSIEGERTVARFVDRSGAVRGFGLSHPTPALRHSLLAELQQGF
ncbi:MAG TPA: FAD-dependent oxidoreductase [Telluria sp.]|nr:FAD-dependent oxidoreductase [Telluria sp.]